MRPPISYYGGKQKMAHNIVPLIPRHTVYVEPFCGGCAILFAKPWPRVTNTGHYREIINDKDWHLIQFYRELQENPEELCHRIEFTRYSRREWYKAKRILQNAQKHNRTEIAWAVFVYIMQSFGYSGQANGKQSGWGYGCFGRNLPITWARLSYELKNYIERMSCIYVENDDALAVIKRFDSPQTFFYCDPPYPGTELRYSSKYTIEDLQNLIDALDQCEGSFLLSNYDQPGVEIPSDWERFEFSETMTVSHDKKLDKKRTEIVWRRFNRVPVRPEIQALYDSGAFDCFAGPEPPQMSLFDE